MQAFRQPAYDCRDWRGVTQAQAPGWVAAVKPRHCQGEPGHILLLGCACPVLQYQGLVVLDNTLILYLGG